MSENIGNAIREVERALWNLKAALADQPVCYCGNGPEHRRGELMECVHYQPAGVLCHAWTFMKTDEGEIVGEAICRLPVGHKGQHIGEEPASEPACTCHDCRVDSQTTHRCSSGCPAHGCTCGPCDFYAGATCGLSRTLGIHSDGEVTAHAWTGVISTNCPVHNPVASRRADADRDREQDCVCSDTEPCNLHGGTR